MIRVIRMRTAFAWTLPIFLIAGLAGCGPAGPKTHPVHGTLQVADGDVKVLAGSHIEGVLENNPAVRASGIIQDDGSFTLETLHQGTPQDGAVEGKFQVRIILADDDPKQRRKAARAVAPRFLAFKTSGLAIEVPPHAEVSLKVASK